MGESVDVPLTILKGVREDVLAKLVAHRGFHDTSDRKTRPLENTERAYSSAWSALTFAECDIQTSKDGAIFLCHDRNFKRLSDSKVAETDVSKLTSEQILSIRLIDGSKPCLLEDVLSVAKKRSSEFNQKKLIVEIKSTASPDLVDKLIQMFKERPSLLNCVGVFMSFKHSIVRDLIARFDATFASKEFASGSLKRKKSMYRPKFMLLCRDMSRCPEMTESKLKDVVKREGCHNFYSSAQTAELRALLKRTKADGVYLQYSPKMLDRDLPSLMKLCKACLVGCWGSSSRKDPDSCVLACKLSMAGVSYINTDMPTHFK